LPGYTKSDTGSNVLPSNKPLSLIFNDGITNNAMNDNVMKGAVSGEPKPLAARSNSA
jgi:hypothetical protein